MEQKTAVRTVTLRELWEIFLHRLWIIVLAAVAISGVAFFAARMNYVPKYDSTAILYILRQDGSDTSGSSDDFSLALKVVSDCDYILKSHSVLDEVIDELGLTASYKDLNGSIATYNPENTRILEVTVTSGSPQEAKRIVDSVCAVGAEKIEEAMGFKQVNLYELGTVNTKPCNTIRLALYVLVGIVAAVLVYTTFLIAFLMDDRIHTEEDIEQYLGLTILGNIPNANNANKKHYGHYSAYGTGIRSNQKKKGG